MAKMFNMDWWKIFKKAIGTGIILGVLSWLVGMVLAQINALGFAWMQYVLLFLAGVGLVLALRFRKGKEDYYEALISFVFMVSVWGLIGQLIGKDPIGTMANGNFFDAVMFTVLFFTSEGVVQRLFKMWKL